MPLNTRPNLPERLIVYVDGFNLYHGLKDRSGRRLLWLDLVNLSRSLRPRSSLVQVKYFTAPVLDDPPAASRQASYQRDCPAAERHDVHGGRLSSKRYSAELRNLMPASFSIGLSKLTGAQLPRTVVDPISGRSFSRPSKWT